MTSETLQKALEQNRENLTLLLNALDADHEIERDPEKAAHLNAAFHPGGAEAAKDVEMTEAERVAWLFDENAKAIAVAAEAAGARGAKSASLTEQDPLDGLGSVLSGGQ